MKEQTEVKNTFCKCGHSLEMHDDQAVCRALVDGKSSCQCLQFSTDLSEIECPKCGHKFWHKVGQGIKEALDQLGNAIGESKFGG